MKKIVFVVLGLAIGAGIYFGKQAAKDMFK